MTVDEWRAHAQRLAAELADAGVLTDPAWRRAIENVPRHMFLPGRADEFATIYSDTTLVTQEIESQGHLYATSSSTAPSLMVRMLQELEVEDGTPVLNGADASNVLEIGTGTGYNAALMSERLGDRKVVSVDIDPIIVSGAYRQLKAAGYDPVLGCRDGREGYPERAPYDRLIATVAFERIPRAWIEQVRPGGLLLVDLRPPGATWMGALAKLRVADDGTATGRFLECEAGFMPARTVVEAPGIPAAVSVDKRNELSRSTTLGADVLRTPGLSLMIWQAFPGLVVHPSKDRSYLYTPDGSWVEVPRDVPGKITFGGNRDLWKEVEAAYFQWSGWGKPSVTRFGMTEGPGAHHVWIDAPHNLVLSPNEQP